MAQLNLAAVTRRFGPVAAVDDLSLEVADGEFVALLGPSGCGKTTLLRLIAGFEQVDAGTIRIGGAVVSAPGTHVPAERRRVGIVFQSYALWPHMSVGRNVGYPLEVARVRGADYRGRVDRALKMVGLADYIDRRPAQLSGGQRQRVALARCLVMEPSLVLLDEPLANLDVHLRASMQDEFLRLHRSTGATRLYITHDQAEAMALADRVVVMDGGRMIQADAPRRLYHEPLTPMVASFIGEGSVVPCEVVGRPAGGTAWVRVLGADAAVRADGPGGTAVCLRPEDLGFAQPGEPALAARIRRAVYKGSHTSLDAVPKAADGVTLRLNITDQTTCREGDDVAIAIRGGWLIPRDDTPPPAR